VYFRLLPRVARDAVFFVRFLRATGTFYPGICQQRQPGRDGGVRRAVTRASSRA
jgi:hypothetical protein